MSRPNLYNHEGYFDPTAFEALSHIEEEAKATQYKPLVYICSPFTGDMEHNAERARGYCRFAVSQNCIPIAPHLIFPQFMEESDPEQRRLGIFYGLVLQGKCKEVWVFGDRVTQGMAVEIEKAKQRGMRLRYFSHRCVEVTAE